MNSVINENACNIRGTHVFHYFKQIHYMAFKGGAVVEAS